MLTAKKKVQYIVFSEIILTDVVFVECQKPLGMESGAISDGNITASSEWDAISHGAHLARLHNTASDGTTGSWTARTNNVYQWLQVNLGDVYTRVTGVATQGRNNYNSRVTKYNLQYGNDGVNFHYYRERGQAANKVKYVKTSKLVFSGN